MYEQVADRVDNGGGITSHTMELVEASTIAGHDYDEVIH